MNIDEEVQQWLNDYDKGEEVESVEMGGIGIEYEQAIQDLAIEIIREYSLYKVGHDADTAIERLDKKHGFSGGQVALAKNLASVLFNTGISKGLGMMKQSEPERIIRIKKDIVGDYVIIIK